jgi:signal transduction histidine kinase
MDPETTLGARARTSGLTPAPRAVPAPAEPEPTTTEATFVAPTTTESVAASTTTLKPPAPKISPDTVDYLTRELFRSNQLLEGVPEAAFERFRREIEVVHFTAEEVIFEEGAPGDCVYLIARGSVKISKKGRGGQQETLSYLSEGDFFGEMALVDDGRRSAQAAAHDECVLGRVNKAGWALLFRVAPTEVLANFTRAITKRLRQNNQHFIEEMMRNERLSMLGTTVSSIVHDMNNPLSCILSASDVIKTQSADPLIHRMSGMIHDSVRRMEAMTHELVEFSRGITRLDVQPTSVAELLRSLEYDFDECRAVGIDVQMNVLDDAELEVDSQRMLRVFSNLLRNAREAMQSTGGQLRFRVEHSDDEASFEVSDTGCGIAADVLPTIFEPFVTHGKAHGTGLGLAISKSIVDAHGGKIAVQSAENAGTTFLITLPAGPKKAP